MSPGRWVPSGLIISISYSTGHSSTAGSRLPDLAVVPKPQVGSWPNYYLPTTPSFVTLFPKRPSIDASLLLCPHPYPTRFTPDILCLSTPALAKRQKKVVACSSSSLFYPSSLLFHSSTTFSSWDKTFVAFLFTSSFLIHGGTSPSHHHHIFYRYPDLIPHLEIFPLHITHLHKPRHPQHAFGS